MSKPNKYNALIDFRNASGALLRVVKEMLPKEQLSTEDKRQVVEYLVRFLPLQKVPRVHPDAQRTAIEKFAHYQGLGSVAGYDPFESLSTGPPLREYAAKIGLRDPRELLADEVVDEAAEAAAAAAAAAEAVAAAAAEAAAAEAAAAQVRSTQTH